MYILYYWKIDFAPELIFMKWREIIFISLKFMFIVKYDHEATFVLIMKI